MTAFYNYKSLLCIQCHGYRGEHTSQGTQLPFTRTYCVLCILIGKHGKGIIIWVYHIKSASKCLFSTFSSNYTELPFSQYFFTLIAFKPSFYLYSIDNQWETIKTTTTIAAKATIGKREMTAKQKWIIPRTLELMEERKQLKPLITRSQEDKERYRLKDKEVRHACEEDKKDYLEGICLHLQEYTRGLKNHSRCVTEPSKMRKIDPLTTLMRSEKDGGATQNHCIRKIRQSTLNGSQYQVGPIAVDPVPAVLPAEVTKTIRHINNNKAPGSDDLNIELIKAIDDDSKMMAQLTHLCNQIITEGKWPAEFRGSIYVPRQERGQNGLQEL